MAIQVHQRRQQGPSLGERLSQNIGSALEEYGKQQKEKKLEAKEKEQYAEENAMVKNLIGKDISGIRNPKIRESFVTYALDAENKKNELQQKTSERSKLLQQVENEGQGQQGQGSFQDRLMQAVPEMEQQLGFKLTPDQIESIGQRLQSGQQQQQQQGQGQQQNQQMGQQQEEIDPFLKAKKYAAIGEHDLSTVAMNEAKQKIKTSTEEKKATRKEELEFHKESNDYDKELLKGYKSALTQIDAIKDVKKALKSGNVKPSSLANMFKGMGTVGDKLANALLNKDEAAILASVPAFLEGRKELFGVRLSDADLTLLQDKLPDISKSAEANKSIMNLMERYSNLATLRYKIGSEIKEKNNGLRPIGYADKIEQRFQEMTFPVAVISPITGRKIEIPAYELSDAIKAGAKLYQKEEGQGNE